MDLGPWGHRGLKNGGSAEGFYEPTAPQTASLVVLPTLVHLGGEPPAISGWVANSRLAAPAPREEHVEERAMNALYAMKPSFLN